MAIKTYIAKRKGQAPNGAIIEEGETFSAEFVELERGTPIKRDGKPDLPGAILRDDDGNAKTKPAKDTPDWAEEVKVEKPKAKAE